MPGSTGCDCRKKSPAGARRSSLTEIVPERPWVYLLEDTADGASCRATIKNHVRIASPGNILQSATVVSLKMFPLPHAAECAADASAN
jgi:hypothetical protein